MPNRKPLDIIYPTIVNVERFHQIVVSQRGSTGYNSVGLVDVGIEWAKHTITYHLDSKQIDLLAHKNNKKHHHPTTINGPFHSYRVNRTLPPSPI